MIFNIFFPLEIELENNNLDGFNKLVAGQPVRDEISLKDDIFKVQKYEVKKKEIQSLSTPIESLKQMQKKKCVTINLFEQLTNHYKDTFVNEFESNQYTLPLLNEIQGWPFQKQLSNFQIWEIDNSSDKYFVLSYDGFVKNGDDQRSPYICHIFKFDSKYKVFVSLKELCLDVIPNDFNSNGERIYNRIFINSKGIYYYQKDIQEKEKKQEVEEQVKEVKLYCDQNHELQHVIVLPQHYYGGVYCCNVCRISKDVSFGAECCRQCDYDMCPSCAASNGLVQKIKKKDQFEKLKLFFHQFDQNQDLNLKEPIKREEIQKQNIIFEELREYEIVLPEDLTTPFQHLDFGFMGLAKQSLSKNIDDQNIIISIMKPFATTENLLLIYQMKNTKSPIIRYERLQYQVVPSFTFYNFNEQTGIHDYIIKTSIHNCNYVIQRDRNEVECKTTISFYQAEVHQGKYDWGRHHDGHIDVQEMYIDMESRSPFTQTFYVSVYGLVELIYPSWSTYESPLIKQYIMRQLNIREQDYEIITLYKNKKIEYIKFDDYENQKLKDTLKTLNIESFQDTISQRFIYQDMIITSNRAGCVYVMYTTDEQPDQFIFTVDDLQKKQGQKYLFKQILNNFDNEIAKLPYQKNSCHPYINQEISNLYMHQNRKQVFTSQYQGFVEEKVFKFSQDKLLIDLSQQNSDEKNCFKLIQLYSEECKDLKLLKYHRNKQHAIFFFIHRNKRQEVTRPKAEENDEKDQQIDENQDKGQIIEKDGKEDKNLGQLKKEDKKDKEKKVEMETVVIEGEEIRGVCFFVVKEIQNLKIDISMQKCLIEKGSEIFIPKNLNEIIKTNYDEQSILQYHQNSIKPLNTLNFLSFETFKDFKDPNQDYIPFIFTQTIDEGKFDPYLCILDIDLLFKEIHEEAEQENHQSSSKFFERKDTDYRQASFKKSSTKTSKNLNRQESQIIESKINYSNCIQAFKIHYNQRQDEPSSIKDCTRENSSMRLDVLPHTVGCQMMFSRSSNWQKKKGILQAKFQIGADIIFGEIQKSIHCIEIKEYLLQFSEKKEFKNLDQNVFQHAKDFSSKINIIPVQIQYATFNFQFFGDLQNYIQILAYNNRIVPFINDKGKIKGTNLLVNYDILQGKQSQKITSNIDYLKKCNDDPVYSAFFKELDKKEEVFEKLKNRQGQILKGDWKEWGNLMKGSFNDKTETEICPIVLEYFENKYSNEYFQKDENGKNEILQNFFGEINDNLHQNLYYYDVIKLQNTEKDFQTINSVNSPFFQANIKTGSQYGLSTVQFSSASIFEYNFDKNDLIYWQYQIVKYLLCANTYSFKDILLSDITKSQLQRILQPNFDLNGQSQICQIIKSNSKQKIDYIKEIISMREEKEYLQCLQNSVISFTLNGPQEQQNKMIKDFMKSIDLDNTFNLMCDFVNQKTLIEFLLENKKMKEANQIVDNLIKNNYDNQSLKILYFDLTQLLYFKKFNLNDLMNIDNQEEQFMMEQSHQINNEDKIYYCNFEQIFTDSSLPQYGNNELISFISSSQEGIHLSKEELSQNILNEKNKNTESMKPVQLQYSYIDLKPISRNIQIKMIQGRDIDKQESLEYLKQFSQKEKIQCSHFFLAKLIDQNIDTEGFFDQSTTQYIIDIQQKIAKPFVKKMLIMYAFGFAIPFIYNCISLKQTKTGIEESNFHFSFRILLYILNSITQIIFAIFESVEYRYNPGTYWTDKYNYLDFSQPILFSIHLLIRILQIDVYHSGLSNLLDCIIQILIVLGCLSKMFQYIRYREQFSFFVQMFNTVIKQLVEFMIAFIVFTMFFSVISMIMEVDVQGGEDDYPFVFPFARQFFEKYRISIGDVQISQYSQKWKHSQNENSVASSIAQIIIWSCWFLNIFVNNIIMLNLLVAQVGQIYDKVMAQGKTMIYKERAELNKLVFQIYYYLGYKYQYDAIIIQRPYEHLQTFEFDEFVTFSERIKQSTQVSINKLKKEIDKKLDLQNQKLDQILSRL